LKNGRKSGKLAAVGRVVLRPGATSPALAWGIGRGELLPADSLAELVGIADGCQLVQSLRGHLDNDGCGLLRLMLWSMFHGVSTNREGL